MKEMAAISSSTIRKGQSISRLTAIGRGIRAPRVVTPTSAHRSRNSTQLQLPKGRRDPEALKLVIRDWLVPLLVKEFLEQHDANPTAADVDSNQSTTKRTRNKR